MAQRYTIDNEIAAEIADQMVKRLLSELAKNNHSIAKRYADGIQDILYWAIIANAYRPV